MTPKKLIRAMHARRSSTLSCGHYVLAGALIVKADGRWCCLPCRLAQLDHDIPASRGGAEQKGMT